MCTILHNIVKIHPLSLFIDSPQPTLAFDLAPSFCNEDPADLGSATRTPYPPAETSNLSSKKCNIAHLFILPTSKAHVGTILEPSQKASNRPGIDRHDKWDLNSCLNNLGLKYG